MTWLQTNARYIALFLLVGVFIAAVVQCTRGDDNSAQVQQTTRSTDAVASAAADAVSTLEERTSDEKSIDEAVSEVTQGIHDARTVQQIHDAVTAALCGKPAYADDADCQRLRQDTDRVDTPGVL